MDDNPIRDERIIEALECCRPGSDDVAAEDLAHLAAALEADADLETLYERLQQVDARLAAAFHDVPVPDDLQQRLLDRLAAERAPSPAVDAPQPKRVSRRWLLATAGALSASAALLIAAWVHFTQTEPLGEMDVLAAAIRFYNSESPQTGSVESPPADYPFSRYVAGAETTRWRTVKGFLDRKGVAYAYDIRAGGATEATLYVVRPPVGGLPSQPAPKPSYTTAGCSTSAWKENGLLYVLVVHGSSRTYRGFLKLPRGPVA